MLMMNSVLTDEERMLLQALGCKDKAQTIAVLGEMKMILSLSVQTCSHRLSAFLISWIKRRWIMLMECRWLSWKMMIQIDEKTTVSKRYRRYLSVKVLFSAHLLIEVYEYIRFVFRQSSIEI